VWNNEKWRGGCRTKAIRERRRKERETIEEERRNGRGDDKV